MSVWYGAIPERWNTVRLANILREIDEPGTDDLPYLSVSISRGISSHELSDDELNRKIRRSPKSVMNKRIRPNDIVFNMMRAWQGAYGAATVDGMTSPAYIVARPTSDINSKYLELLLRTPAGCYESKRKSYGITDFRLRLYWENFKTICIPLPPRPEQDQIVRYLDWKVSLVNRLINAKKKQIGLLQEQKRTVINEAITEDGEGWQRKPLKYWVKSNELALGSNTDSDFTFDYLDISSVGQGYVKKEPTRFTFDEAPSRARRIVRYGDTIISTVRTYLRSVCFIKRELESCIVSTGFSVLTPDSDSVLPELLSFILTSDRFIDDVIRNSIGVSYPAINDSKLMNIRVALPLALPDQQKLYDKIKSQFFVFDKTITNVQGQVTLLHDYRTRLISDVVTGKMDVRDVSVPDFEEVEEALAEDETDELGADSTEGNDDDEP